MAPPANAAPVETPWRREMPPWAISVVLHAALLLWIGWTFQSVPRGIVEEPGRAVGIVLKSYSDEGERYEGEAEQSAEATESDAPQDPIRAALAALPAADAAADLSAALPQLPVIGPGEAGGLDGIGSAGALTSGPQQPRRASGGKASVRLYGGPQAVGSKFVFVFDHSDSMVGAPLASAKRELMNSLDALESTHQFQIIFFNHQQRIFDLSGQNRIPFATSRTKEMAARFVGGITASGGTNRLDALMKAVRLRPDVIFFLTDADDPMNAAELEEVRTTNRGTASIHCIEFGFGPSSGGTNFLTRIAQQNAGSHVYVDTSRLGR